MVAISRDSGMVTKSANGTWVETFDFVVPFSIYWGKSAEVKTISNKTAIAFDMENDFERYCTSLGRFLETREIDPALKQKYGDDKIVILRHEDRFMLSGCAGRRTLSTWIERTYAFNCLQLSQVVVVSHNDFDRLGPFVMYHADNKFQTIKTEMPQVNQCIYLDALETPGQFDQVFHQPGMSFSSVLRVETNQYQLAFDLWGEPIGYGFGTLYLSIAMFSALLMKKRKQGVVAPELRLAMIGNSATFAILAAVLFLDRVGTSGNFPIALTNIFRTMLSGVGFAIDLLLTSLWREVLHKLEGTSNEAQIARNKRVLFYCAIGVALVEITLIMVLITANNGSEVLLTVFPLILLLCKLVLNIYFLKTSISFKRQLELSLTLASQLSSDIVAQKQRALKIRLVQTMQLNAFSTIMFFIVMILVALNKVYYKSPAGFLGLTVLLLVARAMNGISQVAFCRTSDTAKRTSKVYAAASTTSDAAKIRN